MSAVGRQNENHPFRATAPTTAGGGLAAMSEREPEPGGGPSRRERRFEGVATILLAVAALAAAWSGYQASLWDGVGSTHDADAAAVRTRAATAAGEANQLRLADLGVVESFVNATLTGNATLADFYRERARPELKPALDAWIAAHPLTNPNAPPSPLSMPEYKVAKDAEAARLAADADKANAESRRASHVSNRYTLATLLLAAVLFFAAISERFEVFVPRVTLLSLAGFGLVAGILVMVVQPVTGG